jgi:hypothetical protein
VCFCAGIPPRQWPVPQIEATGLPPSSPTTSCTNRVLWRGGGNALCPSWNATSPTHRTLVRSISQNGHLLDRLVGVRGEMLCIGYLDEPASAELPYASHRAACAHHCVERTDRYARHEAHTRRSRATRSSPTAAPKTVQNDNARECRRRTSREGTAVLRQGTFSGSQQRSLRIGNWNSGSRGTPYGVTHTHFAIVSRARLSLSPSDAVSRIYASRSRAFLEFDC